MRTRESVAALLVILLALPTEAQTLAGPVEIRIRLTGLERYEAPGFAKIERDRFTGQSIHLTGSFVQWTVPDSPHTRSVLRPAKRITGLALAAHDGLLEFAPEGEREHVYVPLDSLARTEEALVPRDRNAWFQAGLLAGIAVFFLVCKAFLNTCGDEGGCGGGTALFGLSIGGGTAVGALIAQNGRTTWRTVPRSELERRLNADNQQDATDQPHQSAHSCGGRVGM
jgi:hypothetical protein